MKHVAERISGVTDKSGTSGKRDCHRATNCVLLISTDEAFTISSGNLFQYRTTRTLATGFASLLVNLESMTTKTRAGGGSKNCVTWKAEKAVYYYNIYVL